MVTHIFYTTQRMLTEINFLSNLYNKCKDNYLQSLYYSGSDRIDSFEHRTTLTHLRTGCTYLTADTSGFNDIPKHEQIYDS